MQNVKLQVPLLVTLLLSIFLSGCFDNQPKITICKEVDLITFPDKIAMRDTISLGNTNVYSEQNRTYTDIYTNTGKRGSYAIKNGILMPTEMLVDMFEYIGDLITEMELANNEINATKK